MFSVAGLTRNLEPETRNRTSDYETFSGSLRGSVVAAEQYSAARDWIFDFQDMIGQPHFRGQRPHDFNFQIALKIVDRRRRVPTTTVNVHRIHRRHVRQSPLAVAVDVHM